MSPGQSSSRVVQAVTLALLAAFAAGAVGRYLEASWPASLALAVVLGVGLFLLWSSAEERNKTGELGRSIVTGALVGLALAGAQSSANRQLREIDSERQRWAERQSLELTLGTQTSLRGIALSGRDLALFYLHGRQLPDAQLSGTDLCRANLSGANLRGANLDIAAMREVQAQHAKLVRATLWQADLTDGVLFEADLRGALLVSARLHGANFNDADLRAANLSKAKGLNRASFDGAKYDGATRWPRNTNLEALGAVRAKPSRVEPFDTKLPREVHDPRCFSILWTENKPP